MSAVGRLKTFERSIQNATRTGPPLLSGEGRLPFLHERGDAFAIVVAVAELAHRVALAVELGVEALAPAVADHLLDPSEAARRPGGEARGERVHFLVQFVV